MTLDLPTQDANKITRQSKSNFSSSFFFLPAEKREAIRRVYAFFRVIDDVVDEECNPQIQNDKLNAWRQELEATYSNRATQHLTQELKKSIDRFKIPKEYFEKLIDGCEMDISKKNYATFAELYEYCYRVASMVGLVCMKIFEYESETSLKTAESLGIALQLTNIIRDVGIDLKKDRIYLPQEDLNRFGVTLEDLKATKPSENFIKLMEFQFDRALKFYHEGFSEFPKDNSGKLLPARIMGVVYKKLLFKIRTQNYPVLTRKVRFTLAEKFWILFRVLTSKKYGA